MRCSPRLATAFGLDLTTDSGSVSVSDSSRLTVELGGWERLLSRLMPPPPTLDLEKKPMTRTRPALLLLTTLAGAGPVACGGDGESLASLSGEEIFEKTKAAVSAARSVHAAGDTIRGTTINLDLRISETGSTGTLAAEGATIELLFAGDAFFMKADKQSWTALTGDAAAGEVLEGRYVKVPTTADEFANLREFVDWDVFIEEEVMQDGLTTKGETKTINGEEAIGLIDAQSLWTLWIPVEGEPLPLQVVEPGGNTIEFRDWGKPVTIETPPADQVIDLSTLTS